MTERKVKISEAALDVLIGWGVDTIYGIPSGTLSSLMDALDAKQDNIQFIQVRHEETGALAASMQGKFGGSLAVCIGSGGPGATHLINGLYDASMDRIPVVAILGARPETELNLDAFQELNQNPMYENIAVYNKRVAYPEQLPKLVDEAARHAIADRGVAVLEVPSDFGFEEIAADAVYSSGSSRRQLRLADANEADIDAAVALLNQSRRSVIYAGIGTMGHGDKVVALSQKIKAPVITTGKNFETFEWDYEALLGSTYRVGWKPANEAILETDTVLFIGSNFPFAEVQGTFKNVKHFIQVDIDPAMLGKRHKADVAILGDAGQVLTRLIEKVDAREADGWWRANLANVKNWREFMNKLEQKESGPLQFYQVYHAINNHADEDAIYSIDVGNSTQTSVRHLHMTPKNMWRTSPLFATMGIALPGGIAAKRTYPDRQVWNLIGDGAFNMSYPDVATNVQYNLPVINIVFSNTEYAFIKNKYEDTNETLFGTDFMDVDYAMVAEAQGAVGYTVDRIEDIDGVIKQAVADNKKGRTVVVNCRITKERPIPVETLKLDPKFYSEEEIQAYQERYEAEDLVPFRLFLEAEGLGSKVE
ncbi:pyruvate oxidase [Fundicoccus culcitae]|uniref:Pyruvate oxidase n=1 Tax=Fundicoccus culcitae TaxID=2969821 RepID=A0ABY5P2P4_9LACT|nr:pyruvate oxidase [Fundicoccus culcitae]UUX32750.1 pyruvate oxidase [Fundicoccus culcitae]